VYFANPSAAWEDYGEGGMKRSRAEFDIVRTLPQGSGLFLLCQGPSSVVAQLPLAGLEDEIAVLSGRESTVRLLDEMPGSVLADPGKMLGTLHAQRRQMTEMA
jgi:type IV secretory pathway VirB4 component